MVDQNDTQMVAGERGGGGERGRNGRWIRGVQTHWGMSSRWVSACISGGNIGWNGLKGCLSWGGGWRVPLTDGWVGKVLRLTYSILTIYCYALFGEPMNRTQ